jgi:hypothetical protein
MTLDEAVEEALTMCDMSRCQEAEKAGRMAASLQD